MSDFTMNNRKIAAAALTVMALGLSACGGGSKGDPSASATPTPSAAASSAASASATPTPTPTIAPTPLPSIDAISVSGNYGQTPTVTAPYPFNVSETQSKIIKQGTGPKIPDDKSSVELGYVGINASTGEVFDSSFDRTPVVFPLDGVIPGFAKGLVGKEQGSRVLITVTSADGYDPQGIPQAKIMPGDTLIFIVDILRTQLTGPSGAAAALPAGLPAVADKNGVPEIAIGTAAEPTETKAYPIVQGTGSAVAAEDQITTHSRCMTWSGTEVYSDYGQAVTNDTAATAMQPLFTALVGQTEGSRLLVTIPGDKAYPNGNPTPSIAPNSALACVVDILFTQPAPQTGR